MLVVSSVDALRRRPVLDFAVLKPVEGLKRTAYKPRSVPTKAHVVSPRLEPRSSASKLLDRRVANTVVSPDLSVYLSGCRADLHLGLLRHRLW